MLNLVVTALEQLIDIQKQLINYAEQKKTALIERKIGDLDLLVQKEEKLVKQLGGVEIERQRLVGELLEKHPATSFAEFTEQIPDELTRTKVQSQLRTLQQLLTELQEKNEANEQILKDSMSFVQYMIGQVTKSKQQHFNYRSPASQQKPPTNNHGFFDAKA